MNIRMAIPYEKDAIRSLWEYCFDDSKEFVEWFFSTIYTPENTLVLCKEKKIHSAMQLLPYKISLRGKAMSTSYIVGVSTWPQDRGMGYVSKLMVNALKTMRNRGQWIGILLPFDYGFYERYGWGTCYSYNEYSGDVDSFTSLVDKIKSKGVISPISLTRDLGDLIHCYSEETRLLNGYVLRDKDNWERILTDMKIDGGGGYILKRDNQTIGYILLTNSHDGVVIRNIYSKDMLGYMEMLRFAIAFQNKYNHITWMNRLGVQPLPGMTELGILRTEKPFVMGRIIDVVKAFENIHSLDNIDLIIRVSDSLLKWNDDTFHLRTKNSMIHPQSIIKKPDLEIDISTLSQLLWGYYTPKQAMEYGLVKIYNKEKLSSLDRLFPPTTTYIYEDF